MDLSCYPEILTDLIDKAAEPLAEKLKIPVEEARPLVFIVCEIIRKDWSGDNFYLGKGFAYDIQRRDIAMYKEFTGSNHKALAKKYEITVRQVYERISIISAAEFNRRQQSLFD